MNSFIQRLQILNNRLALYLTDKGVTANGDETTTQLVEKVQDIQSGNDDVAIGIIQKNIKNLNIPNGTTLIADHAFSEYSSLESVTIPNSVMRIGNMAFYYCRNLKNLTIGNGLTSIYANAFERCYSLKNVIIENGFNCNNLNLSAGGVYTVDTMVSWFNSLADRTGQSAYTLTIGSTNLAYLTDEQKAIAINKNWTLA